MPLPLTVTVSVSTSVLLGSYSVKVIVPVGLIAARQRRRVVQGQRRRAERHAGRAGVVVMRRAGRADRHLLVAEALLSLTALLLASPL